MTHKENSYNWEVESIMHLLIGIMQSKHTSFTWTSKGYHAFGDNNDLGKFTPNT